MRRIGPLVAALLLLLLAPSAARAQVDPVGDHEASWLHQTLQFQYRLGNPLPLRDAPWLGTHNSFNTTTEPPTLSGQDPNQQLNLLDQLRLDMRSLELDAHYVPSVADRGRRTVVLCHGRGSDELHAGCTTERPMAERLSEVVAFLDAHPSQVLLLYVEDHLESRAGYDAAAKVLDDAFGELLHRPAGRRTGCAPMPLDTTRRRIRRSGARVVVISGCGPDGSAWNDLAFDDAERAAHETGPEGFEPYPECDPGRDRRVFDARFVRVFEDSTRLSGTVGGVEGSPPARITPSVARRLTDCGVDLVGLDQLVPGDERLEAFVWSWAEGQPVAQPRGACARIDRRDGRWRTSACTRSKAFACRNPATGRWGIDRRKARFIEGERGTRCPGPFSFAKPRSGAENRKLRDAMRAARVKAAWVNVRAF